MHHNGICIDRLLVPNPFVYLIRTEHPSGIPHQKQQDFKFQWRHLYRLPGHVSPEAASGGPIGIVQEGDIISIDIPGNKLELKIDGEEYNRRMSEFVPKVKPLSGYLKRYAALVSSGAKGAVLN